MTRSRPVRALTALAVTVPLSGGVLLLSAPAANAAVTNPGEGAVFTSDQRIVLRADHGRSSTPNRLTLTSPGGAARVVDESAAGVGAGTLEYALSTDCWTFPSDDCSGRVPAPNGTWTVAQSGGASDEVRFVLRVPPAAPSGVSATPLSPRSVRVSWTRGAEPDLTGFAVLEGDTAVTDDLGTSVCEGSGCSTTVSYADDRPGEHTYVVRAFRSAGPGSDARLASPSSSGARATLAAPASEPTTAPGPGQPVAPSGGTGGGAGGGDGAGEGSGGGTDGGSGAGSGGDTAGGGSGGSGGSGSPSTGTPRPGTSSAPGGTTRPGTTAGGRPSAGGAEAVVAERQAFSRGFSAFGPKLGIPKLPPLPQSSGQAPAVAEPLADGTFEESLGFEDQVLQEEVQTLNPGRRVTSAVSAALDSERLASSTAGALILLLAGAHLRRWIGAPPPD